MTPECRSSAVFQRHQCAPHRGSRGHCSGRTMTRSTSTPVVAVLAVAAAALIFASCGVEAVGPAEAKSPAEQMAERFAETTQKAPPSSPVAEKVDPEAKAIQDAQQLAAKKRAEVKAKKAASAAAEIAVKSAEQLKTDEAEMLAAARAEAEARRIDIETARAEREKVEIAAVAEARRRAEEQKIIERAAVTAQTKAADAAKKADDLRIAEEKRLAEEKVIADAKSADAARIKIAQEAAANAALEAQQIEQARLADLKALEAKRNLETKALAESLRRAEAIRDARSEQKLGALPSIAPSREVERVMQAPVPISPNIVQAAVPQTADPARATNVSRPAKISSPVAVLVLMEPGNKGIRRFDKAADPVLCVKAGCYVSAGTTSSAELRPLVKVLGLSNTLGARAGACKHALGCTFRNVDLVSSAGFIQPVDMKVMVHDRRESQIITEDSDCRLEAQRLLCRRPVVAGSYRLWIVPEDIAARAGSAALDAAVRDGLPASQQAVLSK